MLDEMDERAFFARADVGGLHAKAFLLGQPVVSLGYYSEGLECLIDGSPRDSGMMLAVTILESGVMTLAIGQGLSQAAAKGGISVSCLGNLLAGVPRVLSVIVSQ